MRIMFFGDSICMGQYVSIHKTWIVQISHSLENEATVLNSAINGRTTRQALGDMAYHIQNQYPDILIVQFGMNDCNYWQEDKGVPRVSSKAFEANLEEIIKRAFTFGTKKVFLNTNHPTGRTKFNMPYTNITYEESNKQYNDIIREVVNNQNSEVILNDVEKGFINYLKNNKEYLSRLILPEPDLIHLSNLGHKLYYEIVYPSIKKVVEIYNGNS